MIFTNHNYPEFILKFQPKRDNISMAILSAKGDSKSVTPRSLYALTISAAAASIDDLSPGGILSKA